MSEKEVIYIDPPTHCDNCGNPIGDEFVDGKTTFGPWGNLCMTCHDRYGVGLGTGRGQKYLKRVVEGRTEFVKIEG